MHQPIQIPKALPGMKTDQSLKLNRETIKDTYSQEIKTQLPNIATSRRIDDKTRTITDLKAKPKSGKGEFEETGEKGGQRRVAARPRTLSKPRAAG